MKDHVVALVEAVRLARLELDYQRDAQSRASPERTLRRLDDLLRSREVTEAMLILCPDCESPSITPGREAANLKTRYPSRSH